MHSFPCSLFTGRLGTLPPDGEASAIAKSVVRSTLRLDRQGLAGDVQADRRLHGGEHRALHHFPAEHHARLAVQFPAAAPVLRPGSIGENLSTNGLDEHGVHIGDVFALGRARLELSQPRRPCWKIDARYDSPGMAAWIQAQGCTGWYYRVLESGEIAPGTTLDLLESREEAPTLAEFLAVMRAHRPAADLLERCARLPALAQPWSARIRARLDWLRRHAG